MWRHAAANSRAGRYSHRVITRYALFIVLAVALTTPVLVTSGTAEAKPSAKCALKKKAKCKKAKLVKQKIGKQDLSGANLAGATITGTTFTGTALRDVDLTGAKLTNVTFKDVDLAGAAFDRAQLRNVRFIGVRSPAARAACATAAQRNTDHVFIGAYACSAAGVSFVGANMLGGFFWDSDLDRADFSGTGGSGFMFFFGCDLRQARFDGAGSAIIGSLNDAFFDGVFPKLEPPSHGKVRESNVEGAVFDDATGVGIWGHTNARNVSFVGTTFAPARPVGGMRLQPIDETVDLTGSFGRDGFSALTVTVAADLNTMSAEQLKDKDAAEKRTVLTTRIQDKTPLLRTRQCRDGDTCKLRVPFGYAATVRVVARVPIAGTGNAGTTCVSASTAEGLYAVTCAVAAPVKGSPDLAVSIAKASATTPVAATTVVTVRDPHSALNRSIIQIANAESAFGSDADALACQKDLVCSGKVQVCGAGPCSATVPKDAWVRVTMLRQQSNSYFAVNCPGETGNPIVSARTEWPTGSESDPPPYALRRVCTFQAGSAIALDVAVDVGS